MWKNVSFRTKIILSFLVLMILFSSIHLTLSYTSTKKTVIDSLSSKGLSITLEISKTIDPEMYKRIVERPRETEEFWEFCSRLLDLKTSIGAMYLDTINPLPDGRWIYIADASTKEELLQTPLEEEVGVFPDEAMEAVMRGEVYQTGLIDDPVYGLYFATLVPIRDKDNSVIGILELDLSAAEVSKVFDNVWKSDLIFSIIIDFFMLVLFIGITIWILRFLEKWNKELDHKVRDRTKQVRILLDNVGQGFLTIRPDLTVEKEYSAACETLLGTAPAGLNIIDLLTREQKELADWMPRMLKELFSATEQHIVDMYIQLFPKEITCNGSFLGLSIKVVRQHGFAPEHVILMITDLTEQRALENRLKSEEQLMRMIVTILSRSREYQELVDEYKSFTEDVWPALFTSGELYEQTDQILLRTIHTFKGNFAQLGSFILAPKLHIYESEIKRKTDESIQAWAERVKSFDWKTAFEEEQQKMFEFLPEQNWNNRKDAIPVPRETLISLKKYIAESFPQEVSDPLVKEVEKLYQQTFASLFEPMSENASQLALRLEKMVEPTIIRGGDWYTDLEPWHDWLKSLIHITRNQIDHGIETPDVRIDQGKPYAGQITIDLEKTADEVTICIRDDGAGIDAGKLRNILKQRGIISQDESVQLPDSELYPYLFRDEVSTRDKVTELSGRGVGLAKVLEETEKRNGTVTIKSELGTGTMFIFRFPARDGLLIQEVKISKIA